MPPWALPQSGPGEISWSKDEQLAAASVPNTVLPRLDIGRCVVGHASPDRPALRGFTCVRCCGKPRASIPHALTGKVSAVESQLRPRAAASGSWLPPTGSIKDFHLQSFIHAQRTRFGRCAPCAAQPAPTPRIRYARGHFYSSETGDISIRARQAGVRRSLRAVPRAATLMGPGGRCVVGWAPSEG